MKFGGTSVGDIERIKRAAQFVLHEVRQGAAVAVTTSAMAGRTNQLLELVDALRPAGGEEHWADEADVVASSGETAASGLLALAIRAAGAPARSWQGWQAGVRTDTAHSRARITNWSGEELGAAIDAGEVAVVAGFQGLSGDGRITTLGRGGTDTSAVALAAALGAERCDIYTDVDGVYTTDPRIVPRARRVEKIAFEEMLELASLGAKVLQVRSVELAMARNVRVRVLSSFDEPGSAQPCTIVCPEDEVMEKQVVTGVAYNRDEAKVTVTGLHSRPGVAAAVFMPLAEAQVNVDMIVQSAPSSKEEATITFSVPERELDKTIEVLSARRDQLGYRNLKADRNVAKVSVVGLGMKTHTGVAYQTFKALADKGIDIQAITTSEIKISVLIDAEYVELAVRALHTAFGLDGEASVPVEGALA